MIVTRQQYRNSMLRMRALASGWACRLASRLASGLLLTALCLFSMPAALAQQAGGGGAGGGATAGAPAGKGGKNGALPPLQFPDTNVCLPVAGLTFELSDSESFVVKKGNESVALMRMAMYLPASLHSLSFVANEVCHSGTRSTVLVNGQLYQVAQISRLPQGNTVRVANLNDRGNSATVPE